MSAPSPAPTAMPRKGTKNIIPNSMPQNIPQVAPPPTAWWLVITRSLPSRLRRIAATASGWITRSCSSRPTSSMAANAVVSSGYPMAIRSAMQHLPQAGPPLFGRPWTASWNRAASPAASSRWDESPHVRAASAVPPSHDSSTSGDDQGQPRSDPTDRISSCDTATDGDERVTRMQEPGLTERERTELERLRVEVATLRSQVQPGGGGAGRPAARAGGRGRWRTVVASLLIVVACVLAPLSVVAVWTRNQVTNTDRYVATVTPLASDPAIQKAIADKITAQVFTYIDIRGLTTQAAEALAQRGNLPPRLADQLQAFAVPIANGVQSFTRDQVGKVVASDAFTNAWIQANRTAHAELVKALTGEGGGAVTVENDTVSVNLAAFIQTVKQRLVDAGFSVAARIPAVDASFVLFQSDDIPRARSAFNLLNTLGIWLPILALVLLAVGVYVARDHRRALVGAGIGVAAGMVALALALAVFRALYLDAVPASVLPHDAAAVAYDTIVRFLRLGLRTILVLALVVTAGAFLTGTSATATRTRQGMAGAIGWLAGGAERAGLRTGPVGTWAGANKQALRVAAVAAAALALVFWGRPTGKVVLGLTLALLAALAIIEFLARPAPPIEPTKEPLVQ